VSGHTKWTELRDELRAKPDAQELIARARRLSAEELRHADQAPADPPGQPDSPSA